MSKYVRDIVKSFTDKENNLEATTHTLNVLFKVRDDTTPLTPQKAKIFHNFVARCMYISKRTRPGI